MDLRYTDGGTRLDYVMTKPTTRGIETGVLLFSGGRDSTIAAVRLAKELRKLTLVTITSGHLVALGNVKSRLHELSSILPENTEWVHAVVKQEPLTFDSLLSLSHSLPMPEMPRDLKSCLPCREKAKYIATGYTSYQSNWLEQTPHAITRLRQVLKKHSIELLLPSLPVLSKEDARGVLRSYNLFDDSLEQICLKQQFNDQLVTMDEMTREVDVWAEHLDQALATSLSEDFQINAPITISEVDSDDNR
jgi:hypothetical protein